MLQARKTRRRGPCPRTDLWMVCDESREATERAMTKVVSYIGTWKIHCFCFVLFDFVVSHGYEL